MMTDIEKALESACAKKDRIERELKKCPDFQLYLLTSSINDRMRMEQLLDQNPRFKQWRVLVGRIAEADLCEQSAVSVGAVRMNTSQVGPHSAR